MNKKKCLTLLLALLLSACAHLKTDTQTSFNDRPDVTAFIHHMVSQYHFNQAELNALFASVQVRPKIIHHYRNPAENNPWYAYRTLYLTPRRIEEGVTFWNAYQQPLKRAEHIYGVPSSIIVATIGIESEYGQYTGRHRVIDALTNLAFGGSKRTRYFKQELEDFLLLTRERHLNPYTVMGSYAGAIGQPQFMPSSYRYYAVNFSGVPPIDLSHNEVDVIGSIANFYKSHGWKRNKPVAKQISKRTAHTITLRERDHQEYWQTYHNFGVIMRYNPSTVYAMAVYRLASAISAKKMASLPKGLHHRHNRHPRHKIRKGGKSHHGNRRHR